MPKYKVQRRGSKGSCVFFSTLAAARKFVAGTKYPDRLEVVPITHKGATPWDIDRMWQ